MTETPELAARYGLPRIKHLSVSAVSDYLDCPLRWYGRRVAHWPEPPSAALAMGLALHKALAAHHEATGDAESILLAEWREKVRPLNPPTEAFGMALKALGQYVGSYQTTVWDECEVPLDFRVDGLAVPIIGFIDLIQPGDDGALGRVPDVLLDWKSTSGTSWTQAKADAELQAAVYTHGYTQKVGQPPALFLYAILSLRSGDVQLITTARTPQQCAAAMDTFREVYGRMTRDKPVAKKCQWCPWPTRCAEQRP